MNNLCCIKKYLFGIPVILVIICLITSCVQSTITLDGPYPNTLAEEAKISEKYREPANQLAQDAIQEFLEITKIPRQSGHVEGIRQYLLNFASKNNVKATLDSSGCIYFDLPASEGMENNDSIIIQAHMDMVVASDPSYNNFNPLTTSIEAVYDQENGEIHSKDFKTNIGADDGQGLGLSLALAKNKTIKHGPIRLLFTYDEETTLEGAQKLNPSVLNSKYLINFDAPRCGIIAISSAGGFELSFNNKYLTTSCEKNTSIVEVSVSKLKGGHSGVDINKNRISASNLLTEYLNNLKDQDIPFGLINISCGENDNSIPENLHASLNIDKNNKDKAISIFNSLCEKMKNEHREDSQFEYNVTFYDPTSEQTLSSKDSLEILDATSLMPNGIIKMDETFPDAIESSSNVGIIKLENGNLYEDCLFRSTDYSTIYSQIDELNKSLGNLKMSVTVDESKIIPAWPINDSNLANMYMKAWKEECGINGSKINPHAGMEIAYFYQKNPNIQYISVGADIKDEHALTETLYTKSFSVAIVPVLYIINNVNLL